MVIFLSQTLAIVYFTIVCSMTDQNWWLSIFLNVCWSFLLLTISLPQRNYSCDVGTQESSFLQPFNIILYIAVADLEIFRGGFSFTKTPAKLEVKTKKKVITSFLSHFLLAAAASFVIAQVLNQCTNSCSSRYQSSLIRGTHSFRGGFSWNHCNPPVSATVLW